MLTAASSVARSPLDFDALGASLQHVSEVLCSTRGTAAFVCDLILNKEA